MKHIKLFEAFVNESKEEDIEANLTAIENSKLSDKLKELLRKLVTQPVLGEREKGELNDISSFAGEDGNLYMYITGFAGWDDFEDFSADDDIPGLTFIKITPALSASVISRKDFIDLSKKKVVKEGSPNLTAEELGDDLGDWSKDGIEDYEIYHDMILWQSYHHKIRNMLAKLGVNVTGIPKKIDDYGWHSADGSKNLTNSEMAKWAKELGYGMDGDDDNDY